MTRKVSRYRSKIRPAEVKRHYNRFRTILDEETMEGVEVLTTRYAYEIGRRPSHIEYTEKHDVHVYDEFFRMVYFDQASKRFFRTKKHAEGNLADRLAEVKWDTVLEPLDGEIWDCHEDQSRDEGLPVVTIICMDGYPMQATEGEKVVWDCAKEPEELMSLLKLDLEEGEDPMERAAQEFCKMAERGMWEELAQNLANATIYAN